MSEFFFLSELLNSLWRCRLVSFHSRRIFDFFNSFRKVSPL